MNIIYWVVTTFFFIAYWVMLPSWINDDVELYGLIGAGIAANGAFIGNIIHAIIEKNEKYKLDHNGEDMPFVKNIKSIFGRK